ncbi:MAG: RHS repeat-associated core domain-containing protein [Planctomycetota bacterium]
MSSALSRNVALFVALPLGLLALAGSSRLPGLVEDPILTVHGGSLEAMQLTAATAKQDVLPIMAQRGMRLDGSSRARPLQRMAIQGNPYEKAWSGSSLNGIRLESGTYDVSDVDLALPSDGFSWIVGRTYNNRQDVSGAHVSDGPQGKNWFQVSMPEIALHEAASEVDDVLYLVYGADRFGEFRREGATADTFRGRNGTAGVWHFEDGGATEPDTYTLYDQNGNELVFFGFDDDAAPAEGQLWSITDPDGNKAYVGHATTALTAISSGYTATEGYVSKAYDSSGRRYTYTYGNDAGSTKRLTQVKAEVDDSGWVEVGRVDYEYYGNESHGDTGDLKLVEITTPLTDPGVSSTHKKYYRYWDTGSGGSAHDIKSILGFEGTRSYDWSGDSTFDEGFLTASDTALEAYVDAYFEYSSHKITSAYFNGQCGCSGGSDGLHTISYESNGSFTDTADTYDQTWHSRAVVAQPDGTYLTQYFDEVGQPLSRVLTDGNPTGSVNRWATKVERDANGRVTSVSTSASVTGYTHSTGAITVSTSSGLVWGWSREGSNARSGFLSKKTWKVGSSGSTTTTEEYEYENFSRGINSNESTVYRPILKKVHRYPSEDDQDPGDEETTITDPAESTASLAIESIVTTNPAVATANNGSGSATTRTRYLRDDGTVSFDVDEDGILTYREYTDGQLTKTIQDAESSQTSDFDVTPPADNGAASHRITTYTYDTQGRRETETHADGRVIKLYYTKLADGRLVTLRYNDFVSATPRFYGPVQCSVTNHAGKSEAQATVALTGNDSTTALTGHVDETESDLLAAMDLGSIVRLTTNVYDEAGTRLEESRLYFDVPGSGAGTEGTHYDAMTYGYDDMGRRWRVKAATGTIDRTVFDALGRTSERWMGTNDFSFNGGEALGPDNMVKVEALEYDGDADDGNGYLTKRTEFVQDSATDSRVTTYTNDARGRMLLEARPTAPHALHSYDNLGRRIATGLYSGTGNITAGTTDPASSSGPSDGSTDRLALNRTYYDEMGRVWKTTRHNIDATDGSGDGNLEALNWYDEVGRLVKTDGSQLSKTAFDRLGRQTHRFLLASDNDTLYANATDVAGDIVLEEHQTVYESDDSDDVAMRVTIARHHDDYGSGETLGALDGNGDGDDLLLTAANIAGRPQITAFWYDRFGRVTDTVRYGTYGGSNFDRDGLSVPTRSDTELLMEHSYADDGTVQDVTDPRGLVARTEYDDAGRTTKVIRNYDANVSSGEPSGSDDNQTVRYEYVDGLRTKIVADLPSGSTDQATLYIYGTTNATPSASEISTGHLLRATVYPDSTNSGVTEANINSDSSDVVSFAYNAQGQQVYKKDQEGNVLETEYDDSGRRTKLKVTTLDADFDGAVRRIEWAYTDKGQVDTVTSYDAATSGSAVNQVAYTYDGWGNLTRFRQDKDGAIGGSGYYDVEYSWETATTGRNTLRKTDMTLPSGNVIDFQYLSAGGLHDDEASRVSRLLDGAVRVARYAYSGVGQVVGTDYGQPNIMWELYGSTSGSYPDLDRFNRVTSSRWTTDLATDVDFFDVDITYDRNSNITRVEDNVHVGFDWSYTMDDLDRLSRAERGTWSGSITSQQEDQTWTLDQVGNWDQVTLDFDADNVYTGTDEYDDDRSHNDVNELTGRDTDDNGTDDHTLVYDSNGNLTDDDEDYEYVYDPFGRLRKVNDQPSNLVAEYKYNGLGQMIAVHEDTEPDGDVDGDDEWFYPVHDERWRMVANFREDDSDPKEEWVHHEAGAGGLKGSSYVNAVVLRDRDANTAWTSTSDGTLEERIYYCQSWRGDVSALVDSDGGQVEQVRYSPYGAPFGLPGGDCDSNGDCDDGDTVDSDQIQEWINAAAYDVRGDLDLDGDVDATDKSTVLSFYAGVANGRSVLSTATLANFRGAEGRQVFGFAKKLLQSRNRKTQTSLGRWTARDPLDYVDGVNLYQQTRNNPISRVDPFGLQGVPCPGCDIATSESSLTGNSPLGCFLHVAFTIEEADGGYCASAVEGTLPPGGVGPPAGPVTFSPCGQVVGCTEKVRVEISGMCPVLVGTGTSWSSPVGGWELWSVESVPLPLSAGCNNQPKEISVSLLTVVGGEVGLVTGVHTLSCEECEEVDYFL